MPIRYKIDVLAALKKAGYSTYRIRNEKLLGEATLQNLREDRPVSWDNISTICELLDCQPGDILENQIFSVKVTERQGIINATTMKQMDDVDLSKLNGIRKKTVNIEASSPQDAVFQVANEYDQSPSDDFTPDSITFEAEDSDK